MAELDIFDSFMQDGRTFDERVADAQHIMNTNDDDNKMIACDAFALLSIPRDTKHLAVTVPHKSMNPSIMIMAAMRHLTSLETIVLHPWCGINDAAILSLPKSLRYADLEIDLGWAQHARFTTVKPFQHLVNLQYLRLPKGSTVDSIIEHMPKLVKSYP